MKRAILAVMAITLVTACSGCCCFERLFCCGGGGCCGYGHEGPCGSCGGGCGGGCGSDCYDCGMAGNSVVGGGPGYAQAGPQGHGNGYGGPGAMVAQSHPAEGHPLMHQRRNAGGQYKFAAGPPTAGVTYPYYTNRGPRDFLARNPRSIGP